MPSKPSRIRWQDQPSDRQPGPATGRGQPAGTGQAQPDASRTPLLDSLGRDLSRLAREGRLGPVFGRERETRQLLRILLRKVKNNPLVVGPPGVGKTALVEGLAILIAQGQAPEDLRGARIVELAVAQLMAGTLYRGALEARLQQLVAEAAASPELILFIDEIHTLVRAGVVEGGALDAANILKPALARGELRCIGATTPDEFDRFLHADPAFERRFEALLLEEPSLAEAIEMLLAAAPGYAAHHRVEIEPGAVEAAVHLSARHVLDRRLPDKAFDLLDNACALARLPSQGETVTGPVEIRVNAETVAQALAEKLGLPVQKLTASQQERLAGLEGFLGERVYGQPQALKRVAAALHKTYAGLGDPDRPRQVFAFFGGSGVGKTATAKALAEFLFDSPGALIRLDMSEYEEAHSSARLFGAPPGYVGYNDEGTFASRLRRAPFSIVLLDEIEKAHPQVQESFLQIFDEGRFTDARGRQVDARQAIFILTSNLFSVGEIHSTDEYEAHVAAMRQRLEGFFRPEFVNRIDDVVLFGALSVPVLARIAGRELAALNARLAAHGLSVQASPDVLEWMAERAYDPESGARAVLRSVAKEIAEPASAALVSGELKEGQQLEIVLEGGKITIRLKID